MTVKSIRSSAYCSSYFLIKNVHFQLLLCNSASQHALLLLVAHNWIGYGHKISIGRFRDNWSHSHKCAIFGSYEIL
jgi:hypothetical protein